MSSRLFAASLSALALVFQTACVPILMTTRVQQPDHVSTATLPTFGTIAVVSARYEPRADFSEFDEPGTGMVGQGAMAGAGLWSLFVLLSGCLNPITAPACPALLPTVVGGAGAGAAMASDRASAASDPAQARAAVRTAFRAANLQETVRDRILQYNAATTHQKMQKATDPEPSSPDKQPVYGVLRGENIDTVLEVGVVRIGMDSAGNLSPQSNLYASARARLVRTADGMVLHDSPYEAVSPPLTAQDWAKGNAAAFKHQMLLLLQELAEQIVDDLFLEYQAPNPRSSGYRGMCQDAPLRLLSPASTQRVCTVGLRGHAPWTFSRVNSLQPVLSWESFKTLGDVVADSKMELASITNLRYELRLFTAARYDADIISIGFWMPGDLTYERILEAPSHQIETPLQMCSRYFLTYRARFELNGQPRATRWAGAYHAGPIVRAMTTEPEKVFPRRYYYRFITPCPAESQK